MGSSYIKLFKFASQTASLLSISGLLIVAFTVYTINSSLEANVRDYIATGRVEVIPWYDGVEQRVQRLAAGKKGTENPQFDAYSACADRLQTPPHEAQLGRVFRW